MKIEKFDIVIVLFPFSDSNNYKKRPALVLSDSEKFNRKINHTILAMITSARHNKWPLDIQIIDRNQTSLPKPSIIRMKLFTLDNNLIIKKIGRLSKNDSEKVLLNIRMIF